MPKPCARSQRLTFCHSRSLVVSMPSATTDKPGSPAWRHWPAVCYSGESTREGIDSIGAGQVPVCGRTAGREL
jgi:hypothetical protein